MPEPTNEDTFRRIVTSVVQQKTPDERRNQLARLEYVLHQQIFRTERTPEQYVEFVRQNALALLMSRSPPHIAAGCVAACAIVPCDMQNRGRTLDDFCVHAASAIDAFPTDLVLLGTVVSLVGDIARYEGTALCVASIQQQTAHALRWLSKDKSAPRLVGSRILYVIAMNAPVALRTQLDEFVRVCCQTIADPDEEVRLAVYDTLSLLVKLAAQNKVHVGTCNQDVFAAVRGFLSVSRPPAEVTHAAVLCLKALAKNSEKAFSEFFGGVGDGILPLCAARSDPLRRDAFSLFVTFATLAPDVFASSFSEQIITRVLDIIVRNTYNERFVALSILADLLKVLGKRLAPKKNAIADVLIKYIIPGKIKLSKEPFFALIEFDSAFNMHAIRKITKNMFRKLFEQKPVAENLELRNELFEKYPAASASSRDEYLSIILNIFLQNPQRSTIENVVVPQSAIVPMELTLLSDLFRTKDALVVTDILAATLRATTVLGCDEHILALIDNEVTPFLYNTNEKLFKLAVGACVKVLCMTKKPEEKFISQSGMYSSYVSSIINKLLFVALSSPSEDVRTYVIRNLVEPFDLFLSSPPNISYICNMLFDESFAVQKEVFVIMARLFKNDSLNVRPLLHGAFSRVLTSLKSERDPALINRCTKTLYQLVSSLKEVASLEADAIVDTLLPQITGDNIDLSITSIATISQLSSCYPRCLEEKFDVIADVLLKFIVDTTVNADNAKRRTEAITALGEIAKHTGNVMDPLAKFPKLLPSIMKGISEDNRAFRIMCTSLLGIFGAIDPFYCEGQTVTTGKSASKRELDVLPKKLVNEKEKYEYQALFCILAIEEVISDSAMQSSHKLAAETYCAIVQTLGDSIRPYLKNLIPPVLTFIRDFEKTRQAGFNLLAVMASFCGPYLCDYAESISSVICECWDDSAAPYILLIIEHITLVVGQSIKKLLTASSKNFSSCFQGVVSQNPIDLQLLNAFLECIEVIGPNFEDYMHLSIPSLMAAMEDVGASDETLSSVILFFGRICRVMDITPFLPPIMHSLFRALLKKEKPSVSVLNDVVTAVTYFAKYIPIAYAPFVAQVHSMFQMFGLKELPVYHKYVSKIKQSFKQNSFGAGVYFFAEDGTKEVLFEEPPFRPPVRSIVDVAGRSISTAALPDIRLMAEYDNITDEDWSLWIRNLFLNFLRDSHIACFHHAFKVGKERIRFSEHLFNVSFYATFMSLDDVKQEHLLTEISRIMSHPRAPRDVLFPLLNLWEFMSKEERPFLYEERLRAQTKRPVRDIDVPSFKVSAEQRAVALSAARRKDQKPLSFNTVVDAALRANAYVKALRVYEELYRSMPTNMTYINNLIDTYSFMGMSDAAKGVIALASNSGVAPNETWLERLENWDEALKSYEEKLSTNRTNPDALLGKLRCLKQIGDHNQVCDLSLSVWEDLTPDVKAQVAPILSKSAWWLGSWEVVDRCLPFLKETSVETGLVRIASLVNKKDLSGAKAAIAQTMSFLDSEMSSLIKESYATAYKQAFSATELEELREVIECLETADQGKKRRIYNVFHKRLLGVRRDIEWWQKLLRIQKMAFSPSEYPESWLKFSSICRIAGNPSLAMAALKEVSGIALALDFDQRAEELLLERAQPEVCYAYAKLKWSCAQNVEEQTSSVQFLRSVLSIMPLKNSKLQSKANYRVGMWTKELLKNAPMGTIGERADIAQHFEDAASGDEATGKYCRALARECIEFVEVFVGNADAQSVEPANMEAELQPRITLALKALVASFRNSSSPNLPDILRFLNLSFRYVPYGGVLEMLTGYLRSLDTRIWLPVIPQIVARVHSNNASIRELTRCLIAPLARDYPQAIVYAMVVAAKSHTQADGNAIPEVIKETFANLDVKLRDQIATFSRELTRTAVLWEETWHVSIGQALHYWYERGDLDKAWKILDQPYDMMCREKLSVAEMRFLALYGEELKRALDEMTHFFERTDAKGPMMPLDNSDRQLCLNAWDRWTRVFESLGDSFRDMRSLDLNDVSPKLANLRDAVLCVPGTFTPDGETVCISRVVPSVAILSSKQRPRKMLFLGTNGVEYQFLLKAHEDLRQDERIMQVFDLVNTLLARDARTKNEHLGIVRYTITPLSPKEGLISWVQNSITLNDIVRDYREFKRQQFNMETVILRELCPHHEMCTAIQKVELLQAVMSRTRGQDVRNYLWRSAPNSEAWLHRRQNFTKSTAVMSMVGHVLGIGDRHPCNIMFDTNTWTTVHIDFGDAFEIAMHRTTCPEKVPFRLTRMLVQAMDSGTVEGTFRLTCERIMAMLRSSKNDLMDVLETFLYDPLITWLITSDKKNAQQYDNTPPDEQMSFASESSAVSSAMSSMNSNDDPILSLSDDKPIWDVLNEGAPSSLDDIFKEYNERAVDRELAPIQIEIARTLKRLRVAVESRRAKLLAYNRQTPRREVREMEPPTQDRQNRKAAEMIHKVKMKLDGRENGATMPALTVEKQVDKLIRWAMNIDCLAQAYKGWVPSW